MIVVNVSNSRSASQENQGNKSQRTVIIMLQGSLHSPDDQRNSSVQKLSLLRPAMNTFEFVYSPDTFRFILLF